ncbi:MAG: GerMN domain-containing protein [Oscillospiraceae bacterium]|nr:GerMN domain-containing protein [Oscillospiraceae bacterium]
MKRLTAIFLLLVLAAGLFGCGTEELRSPASFYYYRSDPVFAGTDGVICPETRELAGMEDDLDAILELYFQGPESRDLENLIPERCPVPQWHLDGDTLHLHFTRELADLTGVELTLASACLTRTFLELTGCRKLILTAEGSRLNGETSMVLTLDGLSLRDDSMDRLRGEHTIYYADPSRRYLIGQSINIDLTDREELPVTLFEQMLVPPTGTNLHSLIPANTHIRSIELEDGLCSVDLSLEFVNNRFYSHTEQLLTLTGIVNTLCGISKIDRVEFYVEGNPLVRYGALSITDALVPDERSLGPVRTGLGELEATVYLAHGQQTGLFPVPVRLQQTAGLSQAALMMRLLLEDSGLNGLHTRIPTGTRVNSIRVERRICQVDLSGEFLDGGDPTWAVRVIIASLCTLEDISAVRITVDGAVPAGYSPRLFGVLTPKDAWFL